ncbi:MAG TPA: phosphoglucosamine mutase [Acidimicrobiales bacterium]|nr:phosphoglucosamine mutase [Acidimicrobiales bacterium]
MNVRFGTDGIRGIANVDLDAELVLAIGRAAARVLPARAFLVGRDTRQSGPLLQAALSAGLASEGADVVDLGVLPTPGVAWASAERSLPAAVVSASHNPFIDNGVKLLAAGGTKLPDAVEESIEEELDKILADTGGPLRPSGHGVGRLWSEPEVAEGYVDHLVGVLEPGALDGMHVVLDCANGAAHATAPAALSRLGARLEVLGADPDGTNINDGVGSTHPEALAATVVASGADIGLALDGDADRLLAVDHAGAVVDGDVLMALFAADLAGRGQLAGNTVVVTVMTNLGFRLAMAERSIAVRETPVGDRYVLEALDADGLSLGGEQSGHIVFRQLATTGDGTLTGLLLCDLVRRSGRSFAELAAGSMRRLPQVLVNVPVPGPGAVVEAPSVADALREAEAGLGDSGRVVLRASGTEPLVRVMVEAPDEEGARQVADTLAEVVRAAAAGMPAVEPGAGGAGGADGADGAGAGVGGDAPAPVSP